MNDAEAAMLALALLMRRAMAGDERRYAAGCRGSGKRGLNMMA